MPATTTTNADLKNIFGTALFGVVDDLISAKEKGQQLPGVLDQLAILAKKAKDSGVDLVKQQAHSKLMEYLPWAIVGVLGIVVLISFDKK